MHWGQRHGRVKTASFKGHDHIVAFYPMGTGKPSKEFGQECSMIQFGFTHYEKI